MDDIPLPPNGDRGKTQRRGRSAIRPLFRKKTPHVSTPCRNRQESARSDKHPPSFRDRLRQKRRTSTRSNSRATSRSAHRYRQGPEARRLINSTRGEITIANRDRFEFAKFDIRSIANTDRVLVRFGIDAFAELRTNRADQRSHFIDGTKKSYEFKSIKLARGILGPPPPTPPPHPTPHIWKKGRNIAPRRI